MDEAKRCARDTRRFNAGYIVNEQTGCWEWQKNIQMNGYGHMKHSGKTRSAHRISYEMHHGEIPIGAYVLHRCDNRRCVKPDHLYLGTAKDNALDMKAKRRHSHGEQSTSSKVTEAQVLEMYELFDGGMGSIRVSRKFDICTTQAWHIKTGKSWAHLYSARYGTNDPM